MIAFSKTERMADRPRAAVIGAGIGGLCAAIRLAAVGLRVDLIETQAGPGGKMRTVPSAGGPIDAGPTVLTLRRVFDDLFAATGERLEDHLTLIPQRILARHWWPDGSRLDLHADRDENAATIAAFAGSKAEEEFIRFDRLSARIYDAFDAPMMQAARPDLPGILLNTLRNPAIWPTLLRQRSFAAQMELSFTDPRLRQLFGRYATYVGGVPDLSPAVLSLIWQAEARGVWAIKGGMGKLAHALAGLAGRAGVTLRYGTTAREVLWRSGRVTGLVLEGMGEIACDAVVFNGDPAALRAGLLGDGPGQALRPAQVDPRSLSACVWSFAATPSAIDLAHHNVFFCSNPSDEFGPLAKGRMPDDATLYVCAQDRCHAAPPGSERFEIIMNAPPNTDLSSQEMAACHARTFTRLARFGLTFDPMPGIESLMTPHGFASLFPGSQGAIYGRSPHGTLASFRRPLARTRLPGLYLAGGGAHPGAGVPMAALSGKHAAEAILSDLTSVSRSRPMAMPGGMSMASRPTGRAR